MKRIISGRVWNAMSGKIAALLVASSFVLALTFGGCAVARSAPLPTQEPTSVGEAATATFQIDGLSVYPVQGYPGQEVIVTATVTNRDGIEGEYIAELKINNTVEEQKRVTLPAGAAQTLNFSTFRFEPGTYEVTLGGLTGQFEVLDQATPTQSGTGPATSSCCQQNNSSTAKSSCCGGGSTSTPTTLTTPSTPPRPTTRGGCCGG